MANFIELTYNGQKFFVNMNYVMRIMQTKTGATLRFNDNGSFSVLAVEESYEEVTALIKERYNNAI